MTTTTSDSLSARRAVFYRELGDHHLGALWNVLSSTLTREPAVRSVPQLWRWRDLRPRLLHSGELVTAVEAERRVLYLLNSALPPEQTKVVGNLYAGVQLLLPGEIARTHHHTPNAHPPRHRGHRRLFHYQRQACAHAARRFPDHPIWAWHDHGNAGEDAVMWLDGLDVPFVAEQDAIFFEEYNWNHGTEVQPVSRAADDSITRWGRNLRPSYETFTATTRQC